nr:PREDICTED: uncharacterized protein LOC103995670 isoform X1 [Musa acuminata subsp. malaccensis]
MLDLGGFPMSAAAGSAKRSREKSECLRPERKAKKPESVDDDPDLDLSSDIKGIISALHQIREKALKDGQKKAEETIKSLELEIQSMTDDAKSKFDKERQSLMKALLKSSKECESSLKTEYSKFQAAYEKFCKEKQAHIQAFKDIYSKYEDEKEKLSIRYEQHRKKEKTSLSELEKTCTDKLASAEESLKKKMQVSQRNTTVGQQSGLLCYPPLFYGCFLVFLHHMSFLLKLCISICQSQEFS